MERERSVGPPNLTQTKTLRSGLIELRSQMLRAQRAAPTIEVVETKGRHLLRLLGDCDLSRITAKQLASYADARIEEGASPHTAKKELGVLRQVVKANGLPWDKRIMPDLGRVYIPRERWLTHGEYRSLLAALEPADGRQRRDRRAYVVAWCHLGLRASELYGLRWSDVDWDQRIVRVRGTKTKGADRVLPLNNEAFAALDSRTHLAKPFPVWGNVRRDLIAACGRAKIAPVTPNDLRRTFASWLANAGVSMFATSRLMGHKSTAMVDLVYARLGKNVGRDAVSRIVTGTSESTEAVDAMGGGTG